MCLASLSHNSYETFAQPKLKSPNATKLVSSRILLRVAGRAPRGKRRQNKDTFVKRMQKLAAPGNAFVSTNNWLGRHAISSRAAGHSYSK